MQTRHTVVTRCHFKVHTVLISDFSQLTDCAAEARDSVLMIMQNLLPQFVRSDVRVYPVEHWVQINGRSTHDPPHCREAEVQPETLTINQNLEVVRLDLPILCVSHYKLIRGRSAILRDCDEKLSEKLDF
jgi:hypothetical protein